MLGLTEKVHCVGTNVSDENGELRIYLEGELEPHMQQALLGELSDGALEDFDIDPLVNRTDLELASRQSWFSKTVEIIQGLRGLETVFVFHPDQLQQILDWKRRDREDKVRQGASTASSFSY